MFVVKKSDKMVNKTFRFPAELLDKLESIAQSQKVRVMED